jgi:hypothetical protein
LFSRLSDERPHFAKDVTLGSAVLRLLFLGMLAEEVGDDFLSFPNVIESLSLAVQSYKVSASDKDSTRLILAKPPDSPLYNRAPKTGALPSRVYRAATSGQP